MQQKDHFCDHAIKEIFQKYGLEHLFAVYEHEFQQMRIPGILQLITTPEYAQRWCTITDEYGIIKYQNSTDVTRIIDDKVCARHFSQLSSSYYYSPKYLSTEHNALLYH